MTFQHIPVLLSEIVAATREIPVLRKGLDVTFGRGGHAMALLEEFPALQFLAWDRDHEAVKHGQILMQEHAAGKRLQIEQKTFFSAEDRQTLSDNDFDFIMADLGVSSPQLDDAFLP